MHAGIDAKALLTLWECALGQPPGRRGDALLRAWHAEPARTLGERNARLVELHASLFGAEIELLSHCPACGAAAQFSSNCEALSARMRPQAGLPSPLRLAFAGHLVEFRLPDTADIASVSNEADDAEFAQRLLERCVLSCTRESGPVPVRELPAPVLDALSQQMEALDPGASVSFALDCPHCAAGWEAALDIGEVVWQKVRAAAERALLEIDVLARAYGWTEREVLRLAPLRRAAYLQLATA